MSLSLPDEHMVECVGEVVNRIRINLLHGFNVYDDQEDIELLKLVNPILHDILQSCESL